MEALRVIGVDVGGTKTLAAVVDRHGEIEQDVVHSTDISSQDALLAGLDAIVEELRGGREIAALGFGIPSRVAMGYAYLNGMFGGHAWTEVLAGERWIPLDAALTSDGVADAARFAFTWSSLENGTTASRHHGCSTTSAAWRSTRVTMRLHGVG